MTALFPGIFLGDLELTSDPFMVLFGRDMGAPQNVYETLISSLSNGESLSSTRTSNRDFSLTVGIDGVDLTDLAESEALLIAECDKPRNLLRIEPGDGAPASVFETFRVQATMLFDDDGEMAGLRRYELAFSALPHARAAELTTTPALDVGSDTLTSIDTCASTTGWSSSTGSVSTVGGAVETPGPVSDVANLTRTGSVDFTATPYLVVEWSAAELDVAESREKAADVALGGGWYRTYFVVDGPVAALTFTADARGGDFAIRDVSRTAAPPAIGTRRQLFRTMNVGGSVPTQGSINVEHDTDDLGDSIVYTYPVGLGYQPPLSPWRVLPASRTTDAALISGEYNALSPGSKFHIPAESVPPGEYVVVARLKPATTGIKAINLLSMCYMGGLEVGSENGTTVPVALVAAEWKMCPLGLVNLPQTPVGPDGLVQIRITSADTVDIDEAWIFNTSGRLTMVGAPTKRLSIHAPSLDESSGSIWVGDAADWSDAYSASSLCISRQHHDLAPGLNNVFTVTTGALNAAVSATHYIRGHTFLAE